MKAKVSITVHSLDALNAVQLHNLISDMVRRFGVTPEVEAGNMIIRFTTDDHAQVFVLVEQLQPELARKFSTDLWLSVSTQEA